MTRSATIVWRALALEVSISFHTLSSLAWTTGAKRCSCLAYIARPAGQAVANVAVHFIIAAKKSDNAES
jgi:hypothetical protein